MTDRQQLAFGNVLRQTLKDKWYRAGGSGERVSLASLFRAGALVRRVWRGVEGAPAAAHEYQVSPQMLEMLKEPSKENA